MDEAVLDALQRNGVDVNAFTDYRVRKEWTNERNALRDALTDEEYQAARASTPNAHYTSFPVVQGVWDAVSRLGFKGGRILEPGVGVGHFFGLLPPGISSRSALVGVELDPITARIAQKLYPNADIRAQGYQDARLPDNFFDLIVSNVPFARGGPHDKR